MKNIILFAMLLLILASISSCGTYEKQCPGVGGVIITDLHS